MIAMPVHNWLTLAVAVTAIVPAATGAQQKATAASLVFDHVTVVDVEQGKLVPDRRVVVTGNRIQAVGSGSAVSVPQGAQMVDARGKYLIPGLWDMHMHNISPEPARFALPLAYGITGIRDVGNKHRIDSLLQQRHAVTAGTQRGPRVMISVYITNLQEFAGPDTTDAFVHDSSGLVNGDIQDFVLYRLRVGTPDEARRAIALGKHLGVDLVKLHTDDGWSREVYFTLAAEARRLGIPFAGHLPSNVTMAEASDSGQRSIEHVVMFAANSPCWRTDSEGERQCAALATRLVRNGTWLTPTVVNSLAGQLDPEEPRPMGWYLRHVPDTTERWHGEAKDIMWFVHRLHQFGFPLLAGTDLAFGETRKDLLQQATAHPFVHQELLFLVEGGLTPLEALQTATLNPAKYLGATDSLGTVTVGKLADLVLLDANPLVDIRNTTTIRAVVANGRYFDRVALDSLLAELPED